MLDILKSFLPSTLSDKNLLKLPQNDHDVLRGYLHELKDLKESESAKLATILKAFTNELKAHSRAEEKTFYVPFIAKNKESEIHVLEGFEEHILIDEIVSRLSQAKLGSTIYQARLKVVSELLEHHLKDEEKEHFPLAKEKFTEEELEKWGVEYQVQKKIPETKAGSAKENLKAAKKKVVKKSPAKRKPAPKAKAKSKPKAKKSAQKKKR